MKFNYRVDKIAKDYYDSVDEWGNKTNYGYLVQIVIHALECELATIEHLAMLKTSSKSSIARHCSIAQTILSELLNTGIPREVLQGTRAWDVIAAKGATGWVRDWAFEIRQNHVG